MALCHREVADPGPEAKYDYFVDADYEKAVERLLKERPEGPFRLFAYGSLIWKPEFPTEESLLGVAERWHRSFCMRIEKYRGSPEQPGLMMAFDRSGRCEGDLLRMSEQHLASQLGLLLQREVGSCQALESVRWIDMQGVQGLIRALVFYAHPAHLDYYVNSLPLEQVAHIRAGRATNGVRARNTCIRRYRSLKSSASMMRISGDCRNWLRKRYRAYPPDRKFSRVVPWPKPVGFQRCPCFKGPCARGRNLQFWGIAVYGGTTARCQVLIPIFWLRAIALKSTVK